MGFKAGLVIGAGIGYVLGAKAGRERYDQIVAATQAFMSSSTGQTLESGLRDVWESARQEFPATQRLGDVLDMPDRESGT